MEATYSSVSLRLSSLDKGGGLKPSRTWPPIFRVREVMDKAIPHLLGDWPPVGVV